MQKIAILYDASQAVLSASGLGEVLERVLGIVRDHFQLARGAILLLDETRGELTVRTQFGWPKSVPSMTVPLGKGIIGIAAQQKRPVYSADVTTDPRYIPAVETTRSELAVPLMVGDKVAGVLDCQSDLPDAFDKEIIDLFMLFSAQASIGLQNARLHELEQRRAAQLEAINAIARQIPAVVEMDELLDKLCELILDFFHPDAVALLLREEEGLVLRAQKGKLTPCLQSGLIVPPDQGLCWQALQSGKPVLENNVSGNDQYLAAFEETQAELCLPLVSLGQTVGALVLDSASTDAFRSVEISPLESVADICAAAIQNARYFERVRQLAYRDGLTGIFNRRYFEQRLLQEIDRADRYEKVLSIVMVDIDGFKKVNDEFGHLLGDEVLRQVSNVFTQHLRRSDVLCRYGGDELAILLPETAPAQALAVADKLRRAVAACEFPGVPRPVTVSAGVAGCPADGANRDDLIKAADNALYAAKQAGRNRVFRSGHSEASSQAPASL